MVGLTHNERCLIYNLPQMWPLNSLDLNPWIMLFGVLFSNKSTITENLLLYCRSAETGHCGRMEQVVTVLHWPQHWRMASSSY